MPAEIQARLLEVNALLDALEGAPTATAVVATRLRPPAGRTTTPAAAPTVPPGAGTCGRAAPYRSPARRPDAGLTPGRRRPVNVDGTGRVVYVYG